MTVTLKAVRRNGRFCISLQDRAEFAEGLGGEASRSGGDEALPQEARRGDEVRTVSSAEGHGSSCLQQSQSLHGRAAAEPNTEDGGNASGTWVFAKAPGPMVWPGAGPPGYTQRQGDG